MIVITGCFLVGLAVRTGWGDRSKRSADRILLEKIPGYTLLRGFSGRFAGREESEAFAVALVEIEEGLVPAFVIEQHEDGRYTVMVPSVPTPMAGRLARSSAGDAQVPLKDLRYGRLGSLKRRPGALTTAFPRDFREQDFSPSVNHPQYRLNLTRRWTFHLGVRKDGEK